MKCDLARRRALFATTLACAGVLGACGQRAATPDFRYTLLDGSQRSTADLRGKVLLVNFWATSCSVCVAEMPQIASTHRKYRDRGFETLAVAMRHDPPASVAHFAETRRLPFGVVIDNTGDIANSFGPVDATPTTFVIDKRGAVVERYVGQPDVDALHGLIERLLGEA